MSDLISRQVAIDEIKNMYEAAEKWKCEATDEVVEVRADEMIEARAESCMASLIEMKLRIEKLPSAQPEFTEQDMRDEFNAGYACGMEVAQSERKKGKWIEQDDGWDGVYYECSVCKEPFTLIDGTPQDNLYNFCPNCGADMRHRS